MPALFLFLPPSLPPSNHAYRTFSDGCPGFGREVGGVRDSQGAGGGRLRCIFSQAHPTTSTLDSEGGGGGGGRGVAVGEGLGLRAAAAGAVLIVGGGGTTGERAGVSLEGRSNGDGERLRALVRVTAATAAAAAAKGGGGGRAGLVINLDFGVFGLAHAAGAAVLLAVPRAETELGGLRDG